LFRFGEVARSVLQSTRLEDEFMAHTQKVMLIEDSEDCREILATMIRLMGYEVIFAGDTADVIVVYVDFPQMNTIHTIRALRNDQRTGDMPIIVFLPWAYTEATLAALNAGANAVFDGPITIEALQSGIAKYVPAESEQGEPTAENHAPSIEAVKLRVA